MPPPTIAPGPGTAATTARAASLDSTPTARVTIPRASSSAATVERRCASPAAADQRACLTARLEEQDRELNAVYADLIRRMRRRVGARAGTDPPDVARLRVEQRAWIAQRDVECRRQGRGREGPLWAPVRAACLGEIADYRVEELRERLRGL